MSTHVSRKIPQKLIVGVMNGISTYIMVFHLLDHPVNYLAGILETSHRYFCVVQPVRKCFKSAMKYINIVEVFIHFILER